jgi:hypothetical protein
VPHPYATQGQRARGAHALTLSRTRSSHVLASSLEGPHTPTLSRSRALAALMRLSPAWDARRGPRGPHVVRPQHARYLPREISSTLYARYLPPYTRDIFHLIREISSTLYARYLPPYLQGGASGRGSQAAVCRSCAAHLMCVPLMCRSSHVCAAHVPLMCRSSHGCAAHVPLISCVCRSCAAHVALVRRAAREVCGAASS